MLPVYTIGHGTRTIQNLVALLQQFGIQYLIDVRSRPYSRYNPQFNRENLAASLQQAGLTYVYMGDALGGRPADATCYTNGHVDYDKVETKAFFQAGIARVQAAYQKQVPVALMCSESSPGSCHRSKLIGRCLQQLRIPVQHISEKGVLQSQEQVMQQREGGNAGQLFS